MLKKRVLFTSQAERENSIDLSGCLVRGHRMGGSANVEIVFSIAI